MADNLTTTTTVSTVANGTIIATDQIPGTLEQYQKIKLADGTADSTTMMVVKATAAGSSDAGAVVRPVPGLLDSGGTDMTDTTNHALKVSGVTVQAISGNVADATADSQNPAKIGMKAFAGVSGATMATAANVVDVAAGIDRVQYVRPHCGLEDIVSGVLANTDGASTAVIAAQGAGVKVYITTAILANTSATAVTVDLRDGAAGTVKATLPVPANTSGVICNLPVPLPFSANTAVCMDGSAAATTVTCTLLGFKSKI